MQSKKLSNGVELPLLGFGVYQIPNGEATVQAVEDAINVGYRLFDTAAVYGNEASVGKAISRAMSQGKVKREELFITTKVWTDHQGYERTKNAFQESLDKLGLDYLDLYLIHEPMGDYYGTWRAMQELYEEGKIRAIGVCNMWPDRLLDLTLNAKVKPHVHQIETHPFWQQEKIAPLMKEYGIAHEAWAPFAEGRENIFHNMILKRIADHHGKTVAQVILRWLLQRDIVTLCKSVHKERMKENMEVFDFELMPDEMHTIRLLDHDRPLILNNRDLEVVERISPRQM